MNYVSRLKEGKQVRIKYRRFQNDWTGTNNTSGYQEELWSFDSSLGLFKCRYPVSTYDKDFFTTHSEDYIVSNFREIVSDADKRRGDYSVEDIIVEDNDIQVSTLSLFEQAVEKMKTMSDEEIRRRLFCE